jgi:hypothetical protein
VTRHSRPFLPGELLVALGAICDSPEAARAPAAALGLGPVSSEEHTSVFVLNCPPYASIHLGVEGQMGGEAADRAAGYWRVLGLSVPTEPDHLACLLALYGHLGAALADAASPSARRAIASARAALLWEHLWPWVPGYCHAVASLGSEALGAWATTVQTVLATDLVDVPVDPAKQPARTLPLALRLAPAPLSADAGLDQMLDALVAPLRSGIVLTRDSVARACRTVGVGLRVAERRFALRAMFEQDLPRTLTWLADEAQQWSEQHRRAGTDCTSRWWAQRAAATAAFMDSLSQERETAPTPQPGSV